MTTTADPAVLRARALSLRLMAMRLGASRLHDLPAAAGDETWRGPTASAFQQDARRAVAAVDRAIDDLIRAAQQLEAMAAALAPLGPATMR
jgi:uncharacterized protein YukE